MNRFDIGRYYSFLGKCRKTSLRTNNSIIVIL